LLKLSRFHFQNTPSKKKLSSIQLEDDQHAVNPYPNNMEVQDFGIVNISKVESNTTMVIF
jgi:hypothetical protein